LVNLVVGDTDGTYVEDDTFRFKLYAEDASAAAPDPDRKLASAASDRNERWLGIDRSGMQASGDEASKQATSG
jgi:hypothetical protein